MLEVFKIYFGFNFRGGATFIHECRLLQKSENNIGSLGAGVRVVVSHLLLVVRIELTSS